jgi:RNA polymerase sigma-70 factor (ECF subfamily)
LLAGRADAATALFDHHGRFIQRVLGRILGPDPELMDVLHDVFVEAMQSLHRLGDPKCLRAWLSTVAVHTARGHIRRRRRRRIFQYLPFYAVPQVSVIPRIDEWSEPLRVTYQVLDRMNDDDRILITLRFIEQMELTEVAAAVGVSLATVKRRLAKASVRFFDLAGKEPSLVEWMKEAKR